MKKFLLLAIVAFLAACAVGTEESTEETEGAVGAEELELKGGKKCNDPSKSYVSRDPDECALIHFYCEQGTAFFDRCGCGCQTP